MMNYSTPKKSQQYQSQRSLFYDSPSMPPARFDSKPAGMASSSSTAGADPSNSSLFSAVTGTPKRMPCSPLFKSLNARGSNKTPIKMDVVASDWTHSHSFYNGTGSGASPGKSAPGSPSKSGKYGGGAGRTSSQADRFIPNRQASLPVRSKLDKTGAVGGSGSSSATGGVGSRSSIMEFTDPAVRDRVASAVASVGSGNAGDISGSNSNNINNSNNNSMKESPTSRAYQSSVAEACGIALNTRILEFQPAAPQSNKPIDLRSQYNRPLKATANAQLRRKVPTAPGRVLDAPGLIDDYYLNLLDWSSSNQVAIALERSVYIWNANTGSVASLMESSSDSYVSGIKWSGDGAYLSIGFSDGDIEIWDVEEQSKTRSLNGHSARVGVMAWDRHIMSSGCRDGSIWNHDVRLPEHKVSEFINHTAEVCGLEWRSDGTQLASGGNDNVVNIWDARSTAPKFSKTNHRAAVRAVAWCPWQLNLLATGGGSQDKYIHFWNSTTGARVNSIDTGSQVTSLKWSTTYKEIASTHGFPNNHLTLWSYPTLAKHVDIVAHDSRVLHSALSPDGQTLATCASDENLKFWKIFESVGRKNGGAGASGSSLASGKDVGKVMMIR